MKSFYYLFLFAAILFTLLFAEEGKAKEYEIPTIKIEVTIQSDGDVRITERRTYVFEDSFSWADYRLPFSGFTAVKDIEVSSGGQSFINLDNEKPGTFLVQKNDGTLQVKWFFNAEDEKVSFTISYTLEGAVVIGPEWIEFFWNYISADREKETDSLRIELHLPQAAGTDSLFVWKRGVRDKISTRKNEDGYVATVRNLDNDESVKIRSVFPRSVFNPEAVSTTDKNFSLSSAQKNEQAYLAEYQRQQAHQARYAGYGQILIIITCGLSILAFLFFYRKYGKRHKTDGIPSAGSAEVPGDLKPAVAGWLLANRHVSSNHLMATLFDLARRKYFIIKEQKAEKKMLQKEKPVFAIEKADNPEPDKLTLWEAELKEFAENQVADGNNRLDELFTKNSYKVSKWFNKWKKQLQDYCKAKKWYDEKSIIGMKWSMVVQFLLLIPAILAAVWAGPIGIIAIATVIIFFVSSLAIIRRTREGEEMYTKWKSYKKNLENVGKHAIGKDLTGRHFIYAVAFALSKDNIEGVMKQYNDAAVPAFYWFVFYGGNGAPSAAVVASTFSTLAASGAATAPGVAAGAGAAAGAAGGGAAGGAG